MDRIVWDALMRGRNPNWMRTSRRRSHKLDKAQEHGKIFRSTECICGRPGGLCGMRVRPGHTGRGWHGLMLRRGLSFAART